MRGARYDNFGTAVRWRRKALGRTQKSISAASGVGLSTIRDIEKIGRMPYIDTADMVAKALDTTVDELLSWAEQLDGTRPNKPKRDIPHRTKAPPRPELLGW